MSFTIIDKTVALPPIFTRIPKPSIFKTTLAKQKYWETEKERWHNGYGEIDGMSYFIWQECFIKHRIGGNIDRVKVRDPDLMVSQRCKKAVADGRPVLVIKGRGFGLSSFGGAAINYYTRTFPGCTALVTGKDQSQISMLFSDKIMPVFDNLDTDIRGNILRRNETKSQAFLKASYAFKNDAGDISYGDSQIFCRETSEKVSSPSGFSGTGAKVAFFDEWPLHKRREKLLTSSMPCFQDPITKKIDSLVLLGGTIEDVLTNAELSDLQQTIKNSDNWNIDLVFLPFWLGMCDENGHADEKRGMEWWTKETDRLSKMKDDLGLRAFRMNNPRTLDDIFDLGSGTRFEPDVVDKIKSQHKIIVSSNIPITTCRLTELNGNIETHVDNKGKVSIFENPKPGVEYRLVADGIATGTKVGEEEGSSVAGIVVKGFDPNGDSYSPVCIYEERPETIEQAYYVLINQAKYYNKFGGLKSIHPESNAGNADHIYTFIEKHGLAKYYANRKDLSGKGYSDTKKKGTYVTKDVRDWQMKQANIFLRKYCGNIKMIRLLEDMLKPANENADVLDAWLMFLVDVGPDFDKPIIKRAIPKRTISTIHRRPDGTTYWKEIEVNL